MQYTKPPLTFDQQLDLLISRGLIVNDRPQALKILRQISYYRLSAYCIPFHISKDQFHGSAKFEDVYELYCFDREFRFFLARYIEPIEISIRTILTNYLAHKYDAFGYVDPRNFPPSFDHAKWLFSVEEEVNRSKEIFVEHYRTKYTKMKCLPIWMVSEIFSFGSLSILFSGLFDIDKSAIAKEFGIHHVVLRSWLHSLCYIRNICAHHSRVWNRTLAITPKIPNQSGWTFLIGNRKVFTILTIINYLLKKQGFNDSFKKELKSLLNKYKSVDPARMGFS